MAGRNAFPLSSGFIISRKKTRITFPDGQPDPFDYGRKTIWRTAGRMEIA